MFKLFAKLMALVVVLALAGPFFIRGPDGEPLVSVNNIRHDLSVAGAGFARHWQKLITRFRPDAETVPVYRWQDADGSWHFSESANPDGTGELIYVDPNQNVVPGYDDLGAQQSDSEASKGNIRGILDETHNARQLMDERNAEIEKRAEEER